MSKKVSAPAPAAPAAAPAAAGAPPQATLVPTAIGVFVVFVLLCATLGIVIDNNKDISKVMDMEIAAAAGLCPVNVHWHLGAEHLSVGQYDEHGDGPHDDYELATDDGHHRLLASHRQLASGGVRLGYQCRHYDETDQKFTAPYEWEHCVDMMVGQTYEIHWPHSTVGACGTPYQYQTPFYDGVFCALGDGSAILSGAATAHDNVGVQAQVFTVVNDEAYYYPDLIKGAIFTGNGDDWWTDVAYYTGSTTGTSRDNDVCSAYSPITWQVDRKCHMISASSFDKLCADMKAQTDDMTDDLYAHGARVLVSDELAAAQETSV